MQYSTITHIPATPYSILCADYLLICERNSVAARLLRLFEGWTNGVMDRQLDEEERENALWMRNSASHLASRLLQEYGERTINRALVLLVDLGFLQRRRNPNTSQDRTYYYKFISHKVQSAINGITIEHLQSIFGKGVKLAKETIAFVTANEARNAGTPSKVMPEPKPEDQGEVVSLYCNEPPEVPVPEDSMPTVAAPGPAEAELKGIPHPAVAPEGFSAIPEAAPLETYVTGAQKMQARLERSYHPWETAPGRPVAAFVHWITLQHIHNGDDDTMPPINKARAFIANKARSIEGIGMLQGIYEEWSETPWFNQEFDPVQLNNPANHPALKRKIAGTPEYKHAAHQEFRPQEWQRVSTPATERPPVPPSPELDPGEMGAEQLAARQAGIEKARAIVQGSIAQAESTRKQEEEERREAARQHQLSIKQAAENLAITEELLPTQGATGSAISPPINMHGLGELAQQLMYPVGGAPIPSSEVADDEVDF